MQYEISVDGLLTQLGYTVTESAILQMERIVKNTDGFDKFSKHLLSLNDFLKHINGYVALSNSNDYLKIKCESTNSPEILQEFHEKVKNWADKYKVKLERVLGKDVYYIVGNE